MAVQTTPSEPYSSIRPPVDPVCHVEIPSGYEHQLAIPEFRNQVQVMLELLARRHAEADEDSMARLVDALVAARPIRTVSAAELQLLTRGVDTVLGGTEWLTADQVSAARAATQQQATATNRANLANRWKNEGRVFAITRGGRDYFPRYAFDDAFEPLPVLRDVLRAMQGRSSWGIAAWFESPSSFLGGQRPREVMAPQPKRVLDAALDFVE
ncbi:MAG: hypothetical protein IV100_32045 [Myxococcales bacterium]|nr:hypothetical protein [Myxococcales bacterium]